jgi:hypothetical protein
VQQVEELIWTDRKITDSLATALGVLLV